MRTNQASLALSIGMGLIVLLIGFLALSAAGLVGLPGGEALAVQGEKGVATDSTAMNTAYVPASPAEAAAIAAGDALFKNNCAQCHAVNDKVVGPALAGIDRRRPTTWITKWVKNSSKVVSSGDEYAVKLFDEYGKQQMPSFSQLSDKDIKNIITWISSQESRIASMTDDSSLANNTVPN